MKPPKMYICDKCGREIRIRAKGLCKFCRSKEIGKTKKIEGKDCLDAFFTEQIEILSKHPYCQEDIEIIFNPSRLNIAHIFPKSKHPSVACHPSNVIYLSWQRHFDFDKYLSKGEFDKLEEWKIWPLVCERIRTLLPLVTENSAFRFKIEDYVSVTKV